jgi:hypothetical protein
MILSKLQILLENNLFPKFDYAPGSNRAISICKYIKENGITELIGPQLSKSYEEGFKTYKIFVKVPKYGSSTFKFTKLDEANKFLEYIKSLNNKELDENLNPDALGAGMRIEKQPNVDYMTRK